MNEEMNAWASKFGERHRRGHFWGLALAAAGGFWLLVNLEVVPAPGKLLLPGILLLWGLAEMFNRGREG